MASSEDLCSRCSFLIEAARHVIYHVTSVPSAASFSCHIVQISEFFSHTMRQGSYIYFYRHFIYRDFSLSQMIADRLRLIFSYEQRLLLWAARQRLQKELSLTDTLLYCFQFSRSHFLHTELISTDWRRHFAFSLLLLLRFDIRWLIHFTAASPRHSSSWGAREDILWVFLQRR